MKLVPTPSQTVGPFFSIGFDPLRCVELAAPGVADGRVEIEGQVLDGDGKPVPDAVLEIWQADAQGEYTSAAHSSTSAKFRGFGRVPTDDNGRFRFTTIKPGIVPGPGDLPQAPHLAISLFMRGLLLRLVTRMYFPGERANERDPILNLVESDRRPTLVATADAAHPNRLHWDVRLQGDRETVFFDY